MRGVNVVALYGGQRYDVCSYAPPRCQGPRQIVVGTPGRLLDHLKTRHPSTSKTEGSLRWMKPTKCCVWASSKTLQNYYGADPEGHQTASVLRHHAGSDLRRITRRRFGERAAGSAHSVQRDFSYPS